MPPRCNQIILEETLSQNVYVVQTLNLTDLVYFENSRYEVKRSDEICTSAKSKKVQRF